MCLISTAGLTGAALIGAYVVNTGAAIAAVAGATASYMAYDAQRENAKYNEKVADINAAAAVQYANSIEAQGEWKHRKLATESLLEFGKAKTGYAASGVALGAGTPNDYEADIADAYELDSRQLDFDIQSQKYQALMQGADYANKSTLYGMESRQASAQQPLGTFTGGLNSFMSYSSGVKSLMR